jgi:hypothetical protein
MGVSALYASAGHWRSAGGVSRAPRFRRARAAQAAAPSPARPATRTRVVTDSPKTRAPAHGQEPRTSGVSPRAPAAAAGWVTVKIGGRRRVVGQASCLADRCCLCHCLMKCSDECLRDRWRVSACWWPH